MICSIETYSTVKKVGEEQALHWIAEAGFEGVDYSFYWLPADSLFHTDPLAYAEKLKGSLAKEGLVCKQAHAPFDMAFGDSFDRSNAHYNGVVHAMECAAMLGAEIIVVHGVKIPQEKGSISTVDYNTEFYRSLIPYAERFGIKVAVENLFTSDKKCGCYRPVIGTPEEQCEILRRLASPYLCACVDVGHAALTGIEPDIYLRRMDAKALACLHIQDHDYHRDGHLLPFMGRFEWNAIAAALREKHYEGDISLEVYGFIEPIPPAFLPQALRYACQTAKYVRELVR